MSKERLITFAFLIKKNFKGRFELYDDALLYYHAKGTFKFQIHEDNEVIILCNNIMFSLSKPLHEEDIIQYFITILMSSSSECITYLLGVN